MFTVVLPLITGVSTHGTSVLVRRAGKKEQAQLTLPLLAVIGFQLLYETIVATLAVTHIIPPSDLLCGLEKKWYQLYRAKDRTAIKAIQDSLNCCGFNSVKDKSWPFVDPATCSDVFGRSNSCVGAWRQAEQTNAGLLLIVALVVFLVTVSLCCAPVWSSKTVQASLTFSGADCDLSPNELYLDSSTLGHYRSQRRRSRRWWEGGSEEAH